LLEVRDDRGRNWLHVACGRKGDPQGAIETAEVLLAAGLPLDGAAFTEGAWQATPLWYAVGHGQNRPLAGRLLNRGANPNYCLFAAAWNDDVETIRLLLAHGADIEDDSADGERPLMGAIRWSKFGPALALAEAGADLDWRDRSGMTALHYMLKKGSETRHVAALVALGAGLDIPDAAGRTAREIMARKRDPELRRLAERPA
jgi:ankyrin repeat protein